MTLKYWIREIDERDRTATQRVAAGSYCAIGREISPSGQLA